MQVPATIGFTDADRLRPRLLLGGCVLASAIVIIAAIWISPWLLLALPALGLIAVRVREVLRKLRGELHVSEGTLAFADGVWEIRFDLSGSCVLPLEHPIAGDVHILRDVERFVFLPENPELVALLRQQTALLREASSTGGASKEPFLYEFESPNQGGLAGLVGSVAGAGPFWLFWFTGSIAHLMVGYLTVFAAYVLVRRFKLWPRVHVRLQEDAVDCSGLSRYVWIPYDRIQTLQLLGQGTFIIEGETGKISFLAVGADAAVAHSVLKERCPAAFSGPGMEPWPPGSPVVAKTRATRSHVLSFLVMATLPFGILMACLLVAAGAPLLFPLAFLTPGCAFLLIRIRHGRRRIRAYVFSESEVARERGGREEHWAVSGPCEVVHEIDGASSRLRLRFANREVVINESEVRMPLLLLQDRLRSLYS